MTEKKKPKEKPGEAKQTVDASPMPEQDVLAGIVERGGALIRLENETQSMIAIQRPRDEGAILDACLSELKIYKATAEQAIYAKPVGKLRECPAVQKNGAICGADTKYQDNCPKCKTPVPQKYARGLSVRASESLGNRWDNSSVALKVVGEDDDGADLLAIFMDHERNIKHVLPRRVAKTYKARGGTIKKHADDRFAVVLAAECSKLWREIVLRSLPTGLKAAYYEAAEKAIAGTSKDNLERLVAAFASLETPVSQSKIEEYVGRSLMSFTADNVITMRGLHNAISQGELTTEAAFRKDNTDEPEQAVDGAASIEDVVAGAEEPPPQEEKPQGETTEEQPPVKTDGEKKGAKLI